MDRERSSEITERLYLSLSLYYHHARNLLNQIVLSDSLSGLEEFGTFLAESWTCSDRITDLPFIMNFSSYIGDKNYFESFQIQLLQEPVKEFLRFPTKSGY